MMACNAPGVITNGKSEAATYESAGDYIRAIESWKSYFNETNTETVAGTDFAKAAKAAFSADDLMQAKAWFDQARYKNYADAEMYKMLAEIYNREGNLSKELSALEFCVENYGTTNASVNTRLFAIYSEIDSYEQALQVWGNLDDSSKGEEDNLDIFFRINKKMKNTSTCDSVANILLEANPEHIEALEWNAKKYYWAGQKRYEREMAKYNKKKTRKNYAVLLKELDLVTADFKKALPYLEKLWKQDQSKEYAGYFTNIYARFGDKERVNYYKNFLK